MYLRSSTIKMIWMSIFRNAQAPIATTRADIQQIGLAALLRDKLVLKVGDRDTLSKIVHSNQIPTNSDHRPLHNMYAGMPNTYDERAQEALLNIITKYGSDYSSLKQTKRIFIHYFFDYLLDQMEAKKSEQEKIDVL
jgi:hypothetical protein